jgi:hypothetical protein
MTRLKAKVGAIYENIDYSKWSNRLLPLYFIVKRVAFAVGCWYIKVELVAIFILITMVNLCLVLHTRPYLEKKLYFTELFNESIALVFFTLLQAFKPQFLESKQQYQYGWMGIGMLGIFMLVHLSMNFVPRIASCCRWTKSKCTKAD